MPIERSRSPKCKLLPPINSLAYRINSLTYRISNPKKLHLVKDPVGKDNDRYIQQAVSVAKVVVLAWGNAGSLNDRNQTVLKQLANFSNLYCLEITKKGHPRHPLYIRSNAPRAKTTSRHIEYPFKSRDAVVLFCARWNRNL